jgi:predicted nucleic acid-binding Zn ribbon protein
MRRDKAIASVAYMKCPGCGQKVQRLMNGPARHFRTDDSGRYQWCSQWAGNEKRHA